VASLWAQTGDAARAFRGKKTLLFLSIPPVEQLLWIKAFLKELRLIHAVAPAAKSAGFRVQRNMSGVWSRLRGHRIGSTPVAAIVSPLTQRQIGTGS